MRAKVRRRGDDTGRDDGESRLDPLLLVGWLAGGDDGGGTAAVRWGRCRCCDVLRRWGARAMDASASLS